MNVKMKYLQLLIAFYLTPFTFLFCQNIPHIPFPLEPLKYDTSLVKACIASKFNVTYKVSKVATGIISFVLSRENSTCIADPKEPFNETDLKFEFLCNLRLL